MPTDHAAGGLGPANGTAHSWSRPIVRALQSDTATVRLQRHNLQQETKPGARPQQTGVGSVASANGSCVEVDGPPVQQQADHTATKALAALPPPLLRRLPPSTSMPAAAEAAGRQQCSAASSQSDLHASSSAEQQPQQSEGPPMVCTDQAETAHRTTAIAAGRCASAGSGAAASQQPAAAATTGLRMNTAAKAAPPLEPSVAATQEALHTQLQRPLFPQGWSWTWGGTAPAGRSRQDQQDQQEQHAGSPSSHTAPAECSQQHSPQQTSARRAVIIAALMVWISCGWNGGGLVPGAEAANASLPPLWNLANNVTLFVKTFNSTQVCVVTGCSDFTSYLHPHDWQRVYCSDDEVDSAEHASAWMPCLLLFSHCSKPRSTWHSR